MTTDDDETLRAWALTVRNEPLKAMAEDMPHVRDASKVEVVEWLLVHERRRLTESHRITTGGRRA